MKLESEILILNKLGFKFNIIPLELRPTVTSYKNDLSRKDCEDIIGSANNILEQQQDKNDFSILTDDIEDAYNKFTFKLWKRRKTLIIS